MEKLKRDAPTNKKHQSVFNSQKEKNIYWHKLSKSQKIALMDSGPP